MSLNFGTTVKNQAGMQGINGFILEDQQNTSDLSYDIIAKKSYMIIWSWGRNFAACLKL